MEGQLATNTNSAAASSAARISDALLDDTQVPLPKRPCLDVPTLTARLIGNPEGSNAVPPKDVAAILSEIVTAQQHQMDQLMQYQKQQSDNIAASLQQLAGAISNSMSGVPQRPPTDQPAPTQATQSIPSSPVAPPEHVPIPHDLDKIILKQTRSFKDSVFRLARARTHLKKLESDLAIFDKEGNDYHPAKYRAFTSSTAFAQLDLPLTDSSSSEFKFEVAIPAGTSRRDAMSLVHRASIRFLVHCQHQGQLEHITSVEAQADPSVLRNIVQEVVIEASKPELAQVFGLPKPITTQISESAVSARVDSLYSSIYSKLNQKLMADNAATEKSKQVEQERDSAITTSTPDQLLEKLLEKKIDVKLHEAGLTSGPPDADMSLPADADPITASAFVQSLPGNGQSPSAGVGHSSTAQAPLLRPTPKSNAKRTNAGSPSGKGKRKGKPNGKGKGEPSGKGKGTRPLQRGKGKAQDKGAGKGKRSTSFGKSAGRVGKHGGKAQV